MTANEQDLYDRQLARALNLYQCTASADTFDNAINKIKNIENRVSSLVINTMCDLKSDMQELAQKLASAGKKVSALILLPSDMFVAESDGVTSVTPENNLSFMPILIRPTENFSPPSMPISMVVTDSEKIAKQAIALKRDLAEQLEWFQQYGRNGGLLTAAEKGADKPKSRHLSIVSDTTIPAKAA